MTSIYTIQNGPELQLADAGVLPDLVFLFQCSIKITMRLKIYV
jgi:hypothetical protein